MAYTGIFATEAEIQSKEGAGVSTSVTDVMRTAWALQVESYINVVVRFNFSDAFAGLNVDVKGILAETASGLIAIYGINYDMGGYTTRGEAESMINVLRDVALRNIGILRDKKQETFIKAA